MNIEFYKYQGTGNDFVIIDNRSLNFPKNDTKLVAQLCDRKFGVGADGLLLLEPNDSSDFTMVYYNSDGKLSSMCGNGGRCIVHFARFLGIINVETVFQAVDGLHHARIQRDEVSLQMNDVKDMALNSDGVFLDTGSPHHVCMVKNLEHYEVFNEGRRLRNEVYGPEGANINFVEPGNENTFAVRTYERGVEDETLSCGTGVTAVALAMHEIGKTNSKEVIIQTPGGVLKVTFEKKGNGYKNIRLIGSAVQVFKGIWS